MENKSTLGQLLKKSVKAKRIPVTEIAEYLSVSKSAVYQWFKDEQIPKLENLERLSSLLGVNLGEYLPDEKIGMKKHLEQSVIIPPIGSPPYAPGLLLLNFNELLKYRETGFYQDDWLGDVEYVDKGLLDAILFGSNEHPIVLISNTVYPELAIREGDKILCTHLDRLHWQYMSGVFAILLNNGTVLLRRVTSSSDDDVTIENPDKSSSRINKDNIKAIWTVHYVLTPRLIR